MLDRISFFLLSILTIFTQALHLEVLFLVVYQNSRTALPRQQQDLQTAGLELAGY